MLTAYRRHRKNCPHRSEGRKYRRCRCPIWADGWLGDQEIRESLKLRDWDKAQEKIREWEAEGRITQEPEEITIDAACQDFIRDARARGLREPTLGKYDVLFRQLQAFARGHGFRFIRELELDALRQFRADWKDSNISALKKLERLRALFRFAHESGWIDANPAAKLKNPVVTDPPTLPFTPEEMMRILAAGEQYPDNYGRTGKANAKRLRALVLLLRYSGMRIGDAVTLSPDRLDGDKLFLYTQKTGVPVNCKLPPAVAEALRAAPRDTERYFFWTGEGKVTTATGNWRRAMYKLFELAGVKNGHPHRFRDTFAVELLLSGVPLERVSVLLGHRSIRVTERHYAPWVRARQEQLEADLERAWSFDPVLIAQTKGTPEVHRKRKVVN